MDGIFTTPSRTGGEPCGTDAVLVTAVLEVMMVLHMLLVSACQVLILYLSLAILLSEINHSS